MRLFVIACEPVGCVVGPHGTQFRFETLQLAARLEGGLSRLQLARDR